MNWLETLFGLAPDGGNGALELSLLLAAFASAFLVRRRARRHRANAVR